MREGTNVRGCKCESVYSTCMRRRGASFKYMCEGEGVYVFEEGGKTCQLDGRKERVCGRGQSVENGRRVCM